MTTVGSSTASARVVVVGAGYAGLAAARDLHRSGIDVVVVEANDRVGGRVHTDRLAHDGSPIDLGGMWLGAGHTRFAELIADAGVTTYPTPDHGESLFADGGAPRRYGSDGAPPLGVGAMAMLALAVWRLDRLAARVDLEAPWRTPHARRLDATTVASWMRTAVPFGPARRLVDATLAQEFCADPASMSLLALLTSLKAAGGVEAMVSSDGGAQQDLLVEGAGAPAVHVAATLGDRVRLSSPVERIEHHAGGAVVHAGDDAISAERVIVAMPPALAGRLSYDPILPAERDALTQQLPMGAVWKIFAVYDEPFWRSLGLSGESLDLMAPITTTFDATRPGGPGLLCTLVGGSRAHDLARRSEPERRRLVLDHVARLFGGRALEPVEYVERFWSDEPWARGGYSGYAPPGVLTTVGRALRRPVGPIHWAGTETATEFDGYIEGAIRSGERAAQEVRRALQPT